jgi:hypothetical protein
MKLVELEVARHDWASMPCGCGRTAEHVGSALLKIARTDSDDEINPIYQRYIDDHVHISGVLYECAVPTVSVALAALADDVAPRARRVFSDLVLCLVGGDAQSPSSQAAGRVLVDECVAAARRGTWILLAEVFHGELIDARSNCFEALSVIETDREWVTQVWRAARDRLGKYVQPDPDLNMYGERETWP